MAIGRLGSRDERVPPPLPRGWGKGVGGGVGRALYRRSSGSGHEKGAAGLPEGGGCQVYLRDPATRSTPQKKAITH